MTRTILKRSLLLSAVLSVALSEPASANWQWSKWGMSVEEVTKAARQPVRKTTDQEVQSESIGTNAQPLMEVAKLTSEYDVQNYKFDAYFLFNATSNKLSCVLLIPKDYNLSEALLDDLRGKYGAPQIDSSLSRLMGRTNYVWTSPDKITYTMGKGYTSLTYCSTQDNGL